MLNLFSVQHACKHAQTFGGPIYSVSSHLVTSDCFWRRDTRTLQHNVSYAVSKHPRWDHGRYRLIQPGKMATKGNMVGSVFHFR